MNIAVITANSLRRLFREPANLFFVFALPLLLILVLGLTVAGAEPRIGVVAEGGLGPSSRELVADLERSEGMTTLVYGDLDEAVGLLQREDLTALVILPDDYDRALAGGSSATLEYLAIPDSGGFEVQGLVQSVVADRNTVLRAARLLAADTGIDVDAAIDEVETVRPRIEGIEVATVDAEQEDYIEVDGVGFLAAQELILFLFLISMTAAAALIQIRRFGVARRMLATPARTGEVVIGLVLGRYAIAVVQAAFIIVASSLIFGLDWGSWPATAAIAGTFALVASAAALLVGALASNENQSTAIGISLGLALAALGGCMVPLEIFPDGLRTAAHVTPHAWAMDAFAEILLRGGGIAQIGLELAVLTAYGLAMIGLGVIALRRAIVG